MTSSKPWLRCESISSKSSSSRQSIEAGLGSWDMEIKVASLLLRTTANLGLLDFKVAEQGKAAITVMALESKGVTSACRFCLLGGSC